MRTTDFNQSDKIFSCLKLNSANVDSSDVLLTAAFAVQSLF